MKSVNYDAGTPKRGEIETLARGEHLTIGRPEAGLRISAAAEEVLGIVEQAFLLLGKSAEAVRIYLIQNAIDLGAQVRRRGRDNWRGG